MPSEELVFRDYRPQDRATLIELLGGGRPAHYSAEKHAVFDWQFFDNPQAAGRSPFIVGCLGEEIVAINGLMPVQARVAGRSLPACWSLDTYVSGHYRGRGFGKALIARVTASAPVMLGFGISDMSDPIFEKFEWKLDDTMATLFYHCGEVGLKGLSKNLMTTWARLIRFKPHAAAADVSVGGPPAEPELDALWQTAASHFPNAVERHGAYLIWRYHRAPVLRYRWVAARSEGRLCALLVTRHHPKESVIVDYVGPLDDAPLLANLLDAACQDLIASGTQRIRCEANHPRMLDALEGVGFRRYHTPGRFRLYSSLPPGQGPSGNWFVMTGDSDNDLFVL
jgi:GNAT superfamily N-acetyltransferase